MGRVIPFPRKSADADSLADATERLFLSGYGDAALAKHLGDWARDRWIKYQNLHPKGIPVPAGFEAAGTALLEEVARQYEALFHEMWLDQLMLEAQRFALTEGPPGSSSDLASGQGRPEARLT